MVAIAGMTSSGDAALVMIRHAGIDRREVVDALRRRWPSLSVGDLSVTPTWAMSVKDAVERALARRGVEPLRVVVLPQQRSFPGSVNDRGGTRVMEVEPMPWLS
jgi:hypothetical protein